MTLPLPEGSELWYCGYRWRERRQMSDREKELMAELLVKVRREPEMTKLVAWGLCVLGLLAGALGPGSGNAYYFSGGFLMFAGLVILKLVVPLQQSRISLAEQDLEAGDLDVYDIVVDTDLGPFTQPNRTVVARTVSGGVLNRYQLEDARRVLPTLVYGAYIPRPVDSVRDPSREERAEMELFWWVNTLTPRILLVSLLVLAWVFLVASNLRQPHGVVGGAIGFLNLFFLSNRIPTKLYGLLWLKRAMPTGWQLRTVAHKNRLVEVIDSTKIPWTVDGIPAMWRRRGPAEFEGTHLIRKSWKEGERHDAQLAIGG